MKHYKYQVEDLYISTIVTFDTGKWETAIGHPEYNGGDLIIVEGYTSEDEAKAGHVKWISIMTASELPQVLISSSTCMLAVILDALAGDNEHHIYPRNIKGPRI